MICPSCKSNQERTTSSNASVVKLRVAAQELRDLADNIDDNAANIETRLDAVGEDVSAKTVDVEQLQQIFRQVKAALSTQLCAAKESSVLNYELWDYYNERHYWNTYVQREEVITALSNVWKALFPNDKGKRAEYVNDAWFAATDRGKEAARKKIEGSA